MSISIRYYSHSDFETIDGWWRAAKEPGPLQEMMPEESSFILELDSKPAAAISIYMTNIKHVCWGENFIVNPSLSGPVRKECTKAVFEHACKWAKEKGYKNLFGLTYQEPLLKRYKELGFVETLRGVTTLLKEL